MNMLLLVPEDFIGPDRVRISGRRHRQLHDVIRAEPGKRCRAGILNGPVGGAVVTAISPEETELTVECMLPPPPKQPIALVVALPRPKTFLKVLHAAVTMGVGRICFLECWKVDKSYWSSPVLTPEPLRETLRLALEQCCDPVMPEVIFRRRFKPFVEDELRSYAGTSRILLAHPGVDAPPPAGPVGETTLLIGPEGGFTEYEVAALEAQGAYSFSLGPRILRTEVAVPALLSRLMRS